MLLEQEALEREPAEPGLIKKPFRHLLLKFLLNGKRPREAQPRSRFRKAARGVLSGCLEANAEMLRVR